eukprot:scaffold7598_cov33-Cyclotella_meneghiniana.AAC.1
MNGFLHKEWTKALNEMWIPAPPDSKGKKVHQREALEQNVCFQRAISIWDIFGAQWACLSEILHGKKSKVIEKDTEKKTNRILEIKENRDEWLRRCDHWMIVIDYSTDDILQIASHLQC